MRFALLSGQAPAQLATRKCWPITCKTPRRCTWLPGPCRPPALCPLPVSCSLCLGAFITTSQ